MWYVSRIYYLGNSTGVVPLSSNFLIEIKNTDNNECRTGRYYEFSHLDVVGFFCTDSKLYACVVNHIGLKLVDYIEDVKIVRSIPRTAIRPSAGVRPINDLYCCDGKFVSHDGEHRECVFITDVIWDIFREHTFEKVHLDKIKEKRCFYIDCWDCSNKYKIIVNDKFITQVTKMKTLINVSNKEY